MHSEVIDEGSWILVYIDSKRRKVLRVGRGKAFTSDKGSIELGRIIGMSYGAEIMTSVGVKAHVYRPSITDLIYSTFSRPTQVIYPKDAGYVVLVLDISPGKKVLEIGMGSGAMTAYMANLVRPDGKIYAYEVREDVANVAIENLERIGLRDYVEVKMRDASQGVDERDVDAAFIDIGDPWRVVNVVFEALKPGCQAAFFIPTFEQVSKLYSSLKSHGGWGDIRAVELIERPIDLKEGAIRPSTRMIGHTGYIVIARKHLKGGSANPYVVKEHQGEQDPRGIIAIRKRS
ncbi:MAG: tRNA (adenine-N1)-methyltransferase [Desulfurococcales archaeon]|jgi:tRNA (adenine57-N1/adenine58-N1)-methyltransferase|nr:tRNA (adenine-N1)-methyltransferase [Desulfurococcales archaeon]